MYKNTKENYIEVSGTFLDNGVLNIIYELEVKENKNHKSKNKNKEKANKEIEEKIK